MQDVTGLALARAFYEEAVAPIVADVVPGRRYTAGLFGPGSDVIGLDDATSRDHGWGPRCKLLLEPDGFEEATRELDAALRARLPTTFRGYTTSFEGGHARPLAVAGPPIAHWVDISTVAQLLDGALGITGVAHLTAIDWLTMHEHRLLTVTSGELFRDDLDVAAVRRTLAHYPDDIRRHLIAAEWLRIAQEQAFPARAGSRGDELGSAVVAGRLAESLMRLAFHVHRTHPAYSKWFGSAFARLPVESLRAPLAALLTAADWQARDRAWTEALAAAIAMHEDAGLLAPGRYVPAPVYLGRPGTGLPAFERGGPPSIETLIEEIRAPITDPEVLALPPALGSINQLSACTDLVDEPRYRERLAALYVTAASPRE